MAVRFTVRLTRGAWPMTLTVEDDKGQRHDLALSLDEADWLAGDLLQARRLILGKLRKPAKTGMKGGRAT